MSPVFDDPRSECTQERALCSRCAPRRPAQRSVWLANQLLSGAYLTMPIQCFSSKKVLAATDIGGRTPTLYVNEAMLGCESASFMQSTFGHEMLHVTRRMAHDPNVERLYQNGTISQQQLEYGKNPDGGRPIAVTSEAVGALCGGTWYRSMAACQSGCGAGGGGCKSLSVSCDEACQ